MHNKFDGAIARRRVRRGRSAALLIISLIWCGEDGLVYAQSLGSVVQTGTGGTSPFYGAASDGGSFAQGLFSGAQAGLAASQNQNMVSSFTGGSGATTGNSGNYFSNLEQYYVPGSASTSDGQELNSASTANAALMNAPCPATWSQTMSTVFQTTATPAVGAAVKSCQTSLATLSQSALTAGLSSTDQATFQQAAQSLQAAESQLDELVNTLGADCGVAPSCNLVGTTSLTNGAQAVSSGAEALQTACSSLPASVSSSNISSAVNAINSAAAAANAVLTSQPVNQVKDACEYGAAYAQQHELYANVDAYSANPTTNIISQMMANPSESSFVQDMLNATYPTAATFSNYFSGCTTTSTSTPGNDTSAGYQTPGTTPGDSTNANAVQVCGGISGSTVDWNAAEKDTWTGISFPDSNAEAINTDCGSSTNGGSTNFAYTYTTSSNSSSIPVKIYALCNDKCTIQLNGNTVLTYDDGNNVGHTVSATTTLTPGPNQIVVSDTNYAGYYGVVLAFYQVNADGTNGPLLFDTNSSWSSPPAGGATVNTGDPGSGTTTVTIPGASTTQLSTSCNAVINCMGTDCYNASNPADQGFTEAATALQALKMMQTDINCTNGTSVAAGNCQPMVFGGSSMYCRTWPSYASSTGFTGNCCDEGLMAPVPPIGEYIKGLFDIYNLATTPQVDAWAMSVMPIASTVNGVKSLISPIDNWTESAYKSMTTWANDAWQYVSSPFESAGADLASTFGISGGKAATAVASDAGVTASASQSTVYTGLLAPIKNSLYNGVSNMLTDILGPGNSSLVQDIMAPFAPASYVNSLHNPIASDINLFASDVMIAYTVYQLATIITNMLTACVQEEFQLGYKRKEEDCQAIGSYCAVKIPLLGCVQTNHVYCCYSSPLSEIIASQIRLNQPNVAGDYGSAQSPNCAGFTPQQLAEVDWSKVNLSAWTAMLAQAGIMTSTDTSASAMYNEYTASHTTGGASTTGTAAANSIAPSQTGGNVTDQYGNSGDSSYDDLERAFSAQGDSGDSTSTP